MKKAYIPLILVGLVILEGLAINLLPERFVFSEYLIIAHWALTFLVFVAVYYDREDTYYSIIYAFLFGLLIDVIYTGILGVYMFSYGLTIYVIHYLQRLLHRNYLVLVLSGIIAIILSDFFIYLMYSVISVTTMGWQNYFLQRLLPTLLANLLFLLIVSPLLTKRLVRWGDEQLDNDN